jgi:predicted nucleic acid-binding protein
MPEPGRDKTLPAIPRAHNRNAATSVNGESPVSQLCEKGLCRRPGGPQDRWQLSDLHGRQTQAGGGNEEGNSITLIATLIISGSCRILRSARSGSVDLREMVRQRLMLDTNIWSQLAKQGQQHQFNQLVHNKQYDVVMPPATLLEVLRTQDRQLRRAVTRHVCRKAWRRLRTEAQVEAADLVAEIYRLRPAWILDCPDLTATTRLEKYWRRTIYDDALKDDRQLLALNQIVGARERREISELQADQQARFWSDGCFRSVDEAREQLPTLVVAPLGPPGSRMSRRAEADGWDAGTKVAPWRFELLSVQRKALVLDPIRVHITGQAATYADWIGAYVDLRRVRSNLRDFGHLILYDVVEEQLPRTWLRWAAALVQHSMKLGRGNPVDAQLAAYLIDADLFVTNDKRFTRILEAVRPSAKVSYAASRYADIHGADGDVVAAVAEVI